MINAGILIAAIILFAISAALLYQMGKLNFLMAKKMVHITAISIVAISPYFVAAASLFWSALLVSVIVFSLTHIGLFRRLNNNRKTWGVFYFSGSFTILIYLFPDQPDLVFYPMIILALADGFAAIIGNRFGKHKYSLSGEIKSIEGSVTFFLFSLICLVVLPRVLPFVELVIDIPTALFLSLFLTLIEAQARKERDNFWIPLGVLYWLLVRVSSVDFNFFMLFGLFSLGVYFIYKFRWLSAGGAVTTWLLGCVLIISPAPIWIVPALVFLVLGSLISKLPRMDSREMEESRTGQQVFCNGGVYTFFLGCYFISSEIIFLVAGMASLTTALSDTTSSEIGRHFGKNTFNILSFKKVPAGVSGGISLIGTFFGFLFALIMAALPFFIWQVYTFQMFLVVAIAGFIGNIADSYIGAIFQIKYRPDANSPWADVPVGNQINQIRGFEWISNNTVNLLATATAGSIGFMGFGLLL